MQQVRSVNTFVIRGTLLSNFDENASDVCQMHAKEVESFEDNEQWWIVAQYDPISNVFDTVKYLNKAKN